MARSAAGEVTDTAVAMGRGRQCKWWLPSDAVLLCVALHLCDVENE